MFVATVGTQATVLMCDMNGMNKKLLHSIQGVTVSLSVHPTKSVLYWADPKGGNIFYINYLNARYNNLVTTEYDMIFTK